MADIQLFASCLNAISDHYQARGIVPLVHEDDMNELIRTLGSIEASVRGPDGAHLTGTWEVQEVQGDEATLCHVSGTAWVVGRRHLPGEVGAGDALLFEGGKVRKMNGVDVEVPNKSATKNRAPQ